MMPSVKAMKRICLMTTRRSLRVTMMETKREMTGIGTKSGEALSLKMRTTVVHHLHSLYHPKVCYSLLKIPSLLTYLQASGAYIPPHLRKAKLDASQPSEEVIKLTRQLKGLLNR